MFISLYSKSCEVLMSSVVPDPSVFFEFRRKVQESELLSQSMENLLRQTGFTGRLSVVIQNGNILKCGYEEGYFARRKVASV